MEKYGRTTQGTYNCIIWCVHSVCWITKATELLSEYVILKALPQQHWLHEHASVLHYMYIACLVCCTAVSVHLPVLAGLVSHKYKCAGHHTNSHKHCYVTCV
jgi:hypothetical protein